jgi:hypothetical protein
MDTRIHPKNDPVVWEQYYEAAIAERDPSVRLWRIAEAQKAILQRARELEENKETDAECQAIENATDFLAELKAASQGDGIGKQVERGDHDSIAS